MTPYDRIGGDSAVRALATRFYQLMDTLPEAQHIRAMHPTDLTSSEEKLYLFLSGWLGGPSLYIERYGHPFLRKRHLPFRIASPERDAWMLCMRGAMKEIVADEDLRTALDEAFTGMADHMRNAPER